MGRPDFRHSGIRRLALARTPYARRWLWIPGSLAAARAPGVLVIRGVGAGASDAPGNNPFRDLAVTLAKLGVVTMRYDLSGVGDSEGPPDATVDFNVEVADARAALAQLARGLLAFAQGRYGTLFALIGSKSAVEEAEEEIAATQHGLEQEKQQ